MSEKINKQFSLAEICDLIRSLPESNKVTFNAPVQGGSMRPFFRPGDIVSMRGGLSHTLKKGTIIGFYSDENDPVIHRVIQVNYENGQLVEITTRGDGRTLPDPPITPDQFIGTVTARIRNGKTLKLDSLFGRIQGQLIAQFQSVLLHKSSLVRNCRIWLRTLPKLRTRR